MRRILWQIFVSTVRDEKRARKSNLLLGRFLQWRLSTTPFSSSEKQFSVIFLGVIALDQGSKFLAEGLGLRVILNRGLSFGVFGGSLTFHFLLAVFATFFLAVLWFFYKDFRSRLPLVVVLGSSISNFLDKVARGGVRDFIFLRDFPVFNLADLFIAFSVIILIHELLSRGDLRRR